MRLFTFFSLLLALFTACARAPVAASAPCAEGRPGDGGVAAPTEAAVIQWSHAFLGAFDRGDTPAVAAALSTNVIRFEGGPPSTRDEELADLAKRKPGSAHLASQTWSKERVSLRPHEAVFIGQAEERSAGNESHGGNVFVGWYTLIWAQEGDAWKLTFWGWQRGGADASRDSWNDIYRSGKGYNKQPNRFLADSVQGVKPGAALDVATGDGRNALYLASKGWKTTGVDYADEGLRMARDAAEKQHLPLEVVNANIDSYDFGTSKWDLVTMIYATSNDKWIERIKPSLKPGGLFVLEFFHKEVGEEGGFATGQLAAMFKDGFDVLHDEVVEGAPDWASDRAVLVRFVAKKR